MDIRMPRLDGSRRPGHLIGSERRARGAGRHHVRPRRVRLRGTPRRSRGFLLKDAPEEQLITAVRCVAACDALIDPSCHPAADRPLHPVGPPRYAGPGRSSTAKLTAREMDVLRLILHWGLSNTEIAAVSW